MKVALEVPPAVEGSAARTGRCLAHALNQRVDVELVRPLGGRGPALAGARRRLTFGSFDLVHGLDGHVPRTLRPRVATLRTPFPQVTDEQVGVSVRAHMQAESAALARRCRRLLAWTSAVRDDFLRYHDVDAEAVEVVAPGIEPRFTPPSKEQVEQVRARHDLKGSYLLFVGRPTLVKNLSRLVQAYARGAFVEEHALVLVGSPSDEYDPIARAVTGLGLDARVRRLGFVPDAELPVLMGGAAALVYPTLQEGLGLPVLEAMACGTPVLCADRWSAPELAGGHAQTCEALDVDSIVEGIVRTLARTSTQREAARAHAARFEWSRAAEATLEVYRRSLA